MAMGPPERTIWIRRAMPRQRIPFTAEGLEIVAKSVEVIGQVVGQEIHEAIAPLVAQVKALEKRVADLKCQGCS